MVARLFFLSICLPFLLTSCQQSKKTVEFVDYVNPLMGTESTFAFSHGNTYPAVAVPWGMNFWSPQTGENGSGWMYTYADSLMRGFRQTHQPSPWMNDYGTFSIMPLAGELKMSHKERLVPFSHQQEKATPYNYSVTFDNGLQTSLSATSRGAVFEVSFPEKEDQYVVVDAYHGGSSITIEPENRLVKGATRYNNGGVPDNFANYFMMEFSHPVIEYGTYNGDTLLHHQTDVAADYTCAYLKFDVPAGEKLTIRTASSFISPEQAAINFNREVADADVQLISGKAREQWNNYLGRVEAEGGTDEQFRTFYSCLYRSMLFPRSFYEIDAKGQVVHYSPYNGKVLPGYMFTDTGFWDTFRCLFPFLNLMYPSMNQKMQEGLVNAYLESGFLPEWASPGHRDCMVGNNSASVVADAYIKGLRGYDIETLWEALKHDANSQLPRTASGRVAYEEYNKLGYVPNNIGIGQNVARTLEYAYNDWTIYTLGKKLGKPASEIDIFKQRANNYKNVYDSKYKLMVGRSDKGEFNPSFKGTDWSRDFCEGNSWHWSFCVFHDPQGLIDLMGGKKEFNHMMDSVFKMPSRLGMDSRGMIHEMREMQVMNMGQYAHGNQPIQHMVYLYNYSGEPWKAQYWVHEIMHKLYTAEADGYCGDEDNGQTSAWYVFSALGFYTVCPGTDQYVLGTPLFKSVKLHLDNGKQVLIQADKADRENRYIKGMKVNGKTYTRNFLTHEQLLGGAKIQYQMSDTPNKQRGTQDSDRPYSFSLE